MVRRESTNKVNYLELEGPSDDEFVWCEVCSEEYKETCPNCGPMKVIKDTAVEEGDPCRARKTLPACLKIGKSSKHGLGVFTKEGMKVGIHFGPYGGVRKEVGDPDLDSGYAFEIEKDGEVAFLIDANLESKSNWMRFVNCASNYGEQNMRAFQYKSNIYYCTMRDIEPNTELLVWYGDEYARTLGLLTPNTRQKTKTDKRQTSKRKCKRKVSDTSYKTDEKGKTKKRLKYSREAAKINSTQKGSTKAKGSRTQTVDFENKLPAIDESNVSTTTNEDCIEKSDASTDVHDLDTELIYHRPSEVQRSDRFVQCGRDSPGLLDISETTENEEVDCYLPGPRSSASTPAHSTDFIFISDEDSGSSEHPSDRTRRENFSEPIRPLKLRISNWKPSNEAAATIASQKKTKSKLNISRKEGSRGKINQSTETKETEGYCHEVAESSSINREITMLQKDLQIKKLETEETQLKLEGKLVERDLFQLDLKKKALNDEILRKQHEIHQLDKEMTSLQTTLKNMKELNTVNIDTQNASSRDKDEEIKHLKQQLETRQQELEIKILEKTEPEIKIQKLLLEQEEGCLQAEINEIRLKEEILKSKTTDIDEQIREVKRNLLRTYRLD